MTALPMACVLDASLGIKLFLPEDDSETLRAFVGRMFADPPIRFFVPDLFFIECANIFWKQVRRGEYRTEQAQQDLADLIRLDWAVTSTMDLVVHAAEIANSHGITAYDACYVALAERLELPLYTADARLRTALAGSPFRVYGLMEA
jgi:predicted nucleic acid-binding protein